MKLKTQNLFQDPLSCTLLGLSGAMFLLSLVFYLMPVILL